MLGVLFDEMVAGLLGLFSRFLSLSLSLSLWGMGYGIWGIFFVITCTGARRCRD